MTKHFQLKKIRGFNKAAEVLFFAYSGKKLEKVLLSPFVGVSYAGNPKDLYTIPGFNEMKEAAKAKRYQLIVTPMSLSGGVKFRSGYTFPLPLQPNLMNGKTTAKRI